MTGFRQSPFITTESLELPRADEEWARDSRSLKIPVSSWEALMSALVRFRSTLPEKLDCKHRRRRWKN